VFVIANATKIREKKINSKLQLQLVIFVYLGGKINGNEHLPT
jgi:hypothetical protein